MNNIKKSYLISSLIGAVIGIIIASIIFIILYFILDLDTYTHQIETHITNKYELKSEQNELINSIKEVYNGVVLIQNHKSNGSIQGTGTGFYYKIDSDYAYLATNNHVIEGASKISILNHDGTIVENVLLVGSDKLSDIAVLKIRKDDAGTILKIGNSDQLILGQKVFTVGSPLGKEYINTITDGIISGLNRNITINNTEMLVLQTTAPINPGNSGGPLINLNGEVIGINSLKIIQEQVEGMGFAIPINEAVKYITDIEQNGKVIRPSFGIQSYDVENLTKFGRKQFKVPKDVETGILIFDIIKDGTANRAGLKKGDIIYKFGNIEVKNINEFRTQLYKRKPGDNVTIEYIREGNRQRVEVTLMATPLE